MREILYHLVKFDDVTFFYFTREELFANINKDAAPRQNGRISRLYVTRVV